MQIGDILHLTPAASGYGSEDLIAAGPGPAGWCISIRSGVFSSWSSGPR